MACRRQNKLRFIHPQNINIYLKARFADPRSCGEPCASAQLPKGIIQSQRGQSRQALRPIGPGFRRARKSLQRKHRQCGQQERNGGGTGMFCTPSKIAAYTVDDRLQSRRAPKITTRPIEADKSAILSPGAWRNAKKSARTPKARTNNGSSLIRFVAPAGAIDFKFVDILCAHAPAGLRGHCTAGLFARFCA